MIPMLAQSGSLPFLLILTVAVISMFTLFRFVRTGHRLLRESIAFGREKVPAAFVFGMSVVIAIVAAYFFGSWGVLAGIPLVVFYAWGRLSKAS